MNTMNIENIDIADVEEATAVIEEVVPKKGFKLPTAGKYFVAGAIATAAVTAVVALVKKKRTKKVEEQEELADDVDADSYDCDDSVDSDVEDE